MSDLDKSFMLFCEYLKKTPEAEFEKVLVKVDEMDFEGQSLKDYVNCENMEYKEKVLVLQEVDLRSERGVENKLFDEYDVTDFIFKNRRDVSESSLILFIKDGGYKVLKNRYATLEEHSHWESLRNKHSLKFEFRERKIR